MKYLILTILWIGFGIIHSFLISIRFTTRIKNLSGKYHAFYRLIYNFISLATFVPLLIYTDRLDSALVIRYSPPWNILQSALLGGSALILVIAFFTYDPLEFLGIRQIINFFTGDKKDASPPTIVRKGLPGIVRHPMYFATIVFMWSLNSTLANVISKLILTLYIVIGTVLEERKLVREFGQDYLEYQREVPMLIPFVKRGK